MLSRNIYQGQIKPKQYFWNNFFKCQMSRLSKAVHKNSQNVLLFTQCNFVPSLHCILYCGTVFYICFLLKQNWSQNRWTFSKYNSKTELKSKHILRIWHKIYFATLRIGDDPWQPSFYTSFALDDVKLKPCAPATGQGPAIMKGGQVTLNDTQRGSLSLSSSPSYSSTSSSSSSSSSSSLV